MCFYLGRLRRAADLSPSLWSVVYRRSDQLGTRMRAIWFSRCLHSCDDDQELDIHIPTILMCVHRNVKHCSRTEVKLKKNQTQILSVHSTDLCDPPVTGAVGGAVLLT